ncbi:MAG: hypothetical protein CMJ49_08860 [Planctomycetaceae bacterium]|nr:hypothetical protein [Planctomycetaceae bacterium]
MRLLIPAVGLLVLLLVVLRWSDPSPRAELTVAYSDIKTLDPQLVSAMLDVRVSYSLFEGLCTFDPATMAVLPGVAERWDLSEDRRTYTFHLREDARWSNGDAVTAWDFREAWRLALMPDLGPPPYVGFLYFIDGAEAYGKWCLKTLMAIREAGDDADKIAMAKRRAANSEAKFDELVAVKVVDDRTLEVRLKLPTPYFLDIVACWPMFPVHRATMARMTTVDENSYNLHRDPTWVHPETIVGNGPYRLARWVFKREMFLEASETYWNREAVGPQTVRMVHYRTTSAAFHAYETGKVDLVFGVGSLAFAPELLEAQRAGERNDVHEVSNFGTYYYVLNCREKLSSGRDNPLADARVRQALNLALDKEEIVPNVQRIKPVVARSFTPPGGLGPDYDHPKGLGYDPDRARDLLAEAGYAGGEGLGPLDLTYNTNQGHGPLVQAVAHAWNKELGIAVETSSKEWKVFLADRNSGNFTVARSGWFGDYGDATTFLDLFLPTNNNNDSGFDDEAYTALMDEAAREADAGRRLELLAEAERIVIEERPVMVPMYHYKLIHLFDPDRLGGVSLHPRGMQMFYRMRVLN